jgi:uncharacterized Ntn-hydrolase superfamily protein
MTLSVLVFDIETGAAGVATATGIAAVGAFVPHAEAGVGALTTQGAYTNWLYGARGLELLRKGYLAKEVLQRLIAEDEGREFRQCLVVDHHSNATAWTGKNNKDVIEIVSEKGIVAGGNLLAKPGVASAMVAAVKDNANKPVALRLFEALQAGAGAGGDSRGLVSSAIKVDFLDKPPVDIRVDYAPENTLEKLWEVYCHYQNPPFKAFYDSLPTRKNYSRYGQVQ